MKNSLLLLAMKVQLRCFIRLKREGAAQSLLTNHCTDDGFKKKVDSLASRDRMQSHFLLASLLLMRTQQRLGDGNARSSVLANVFSVQ
jgi:hypothetical protein